MRNESEDNADRLVNLLARGERTYAQIAEELGLDEDVVACVARGELRPALYQRIRAVQAGLVEEARRLGAKWTRSLLIKHIRSGMGSDSETARKCREFTLSEFLKASPEKQADAILTACAAPRLTSRDLEVLAKANGGPDS